MTKTEHPVWSILNKDKYVEEFYPQAEVMYDFIKGIVATCGNTTKDGNTVLAMKVFFDMWNEFSSETFWILDKLVNTEEQSENREEIMKCEAAHLGLTISEKQECESLKERVRYTGAVVGTTKNEQTDKVFDDAIEKLLAFEKKSN